MQNRIDCDEHGPTISYREEVGGQVRALRAGCSNARVVSRSSARAGRGPGEF